MNARQWFAITHPLNNASDVEAIANLRTIRQRGDDTLVVVILAVDR